MFMRACNRALIHTQAGKSGRELESKDEPVALEWKFYLVRYIL